MSDPQEHPFEYRIADHGAVLVSRGGRQVVTVGGRDAARLVVALERADESQTQELLARATGDTRRGTGRR